MKKNNKSKQIAEKAKKFWNTNLEVIEPKNTLDFPTTEMNDKVPSTGNVLLHKPYRYKSN